MGEYTADDWAEDQRRDAWEPHRSIQHQHYRAGAGYAGVGSDEDDDIEGKMRRQRLARIREGYDAL